MIIALLGFLYIVVPEVIHQVISVNDFGYSKFVWMVYLYTLGATLRLYPPKRKWNKFVYIALPICLITMMRS